VPEWLIGTVCKTVVLTGFAGSNPALSTISMYWGEYLKLKAQKYNFKKRS
jgi:hypothetical protein